MAGMADPAAVDPSAPNAARVYNYWLGGEDHFAADRAAAGRMEQVVPQLPWLARENRKFLTRAVRFCASAGITQFLDIGSGCPAAENVHQMAGQVTADPHVVYADKDPAVGGAGHFSQPVAILLSSVLHLVPDAADPARIVARLRDAMAPGSYLVISHFEISRNHLSDALEGTPVAARTRVEITGFFGDLTLVEPGLVDVWAWRPDTDLLVTMSDVLAGVRIGWNVVTSLGCVGRKDRLPDRAVPPGVSDRQRG
jgi:hypothetical protein